MPSSTQELTQNILAKVSKNRKKLLFFGILSILFGLYGLYSTFTMTKVSIILFGVMMVALGAFFFWEAISDTNKKERLQDILISLLYLATGVIMVSYPVKTAEWFTLLISISLVIIGILRLVSAVKISKTFQDKRVTILVIFGALVSIILGVLIYMDWPESSRWVIGLFVSIEFIIQGIVATVISQKIKGYETKVKEIQS